ncbi:GDSL-like Lipase/Acylhydrolase [Microthyrium microscopicum]|uniref:GDSL-like Lipase/Acylhydrolase n=1 Tax=Microthyrium microscopicum TaxID=703497 RepID=A0A6A6TUX9_9PEZI|nr:GDSL-like Lipase/Acylhydrolase [Microthyrium microscopicum]
MPGLRREFALRQEKAPEFLLAGDSTTAPTSAGGGGWGDGFISILANGAKGENFARNGQTTVSFQKGGQWGKLMDMLKGTVGKTRVYVTIQFGHNDQKEKAGISDTEFSNNLKKLAGQVKSAGGVPILVTPLTRRTFSGGSPTDNLAKQRELTLSAAKQGGYDVIDLNSESRRYVKAIGQQAANKYNLKSDDYTHLNKLGKDVFGRMVSDLIIELKPELKQYFKADPAMSAALKQGKPI